MRWLIGCEVLFLFLLEFCGSYLERFKISVLASGIGWGSIHLISRVYPLCLLWCLWKERNRRIFEDLDSFGDQMLASFSGTLFD